MLARRHQSPDSTFDQVLRRTVSPGCDIAQGRAGNCIQRLAGQKRLMGRDDHIGEGQQPGQHVILQGQVGAVLEEQLGFFFIDVDTEVAELAAFQRADQRRRIDQRAAAGVEVSLAARNDTRS